MGISANTLYLYNFLKVPQATEYQILTHDKVLAFLPIFSSATPFKVVASQYVAIL